MKKHGKKELKKYGNHHIKLYSINIIDILNGLSKSIPVEVVFFYS